MLRKLLSWIRNRRNFVILDAADSSVTLSRALFNHIKKTHGDIEGEPKVFVFYVPVARAYGFSLSVPKEPTQLATIQYNSKYKCVGFETLNPTVARILYDYRVKEFNKPCKLTVTPEKTSTGRLFYVIEHPHEKFTWKGEAS